MSGNQTELSLSKTGGNQKMIEEAQKHESVRAFTGVKFQKIKVCNICESGVDFFTAYFHDCKKVPSAF